MTQTSGQPSANQITVNAAEQDDYIESVTVFQSNRAEIKRRVNIDLKQGQNHVHIERLPSCINEDSIRMDGTGTAIIFDVVYHAPTLQTTTSSNEAVMTSWRALESLQKERDIAREQSEFVASYGRSMNSQTMSIEGLELFVEMFGPRQVAVAKRIQELEIQVEKAENEYNQLRTSVYEDVQGEKRAAKVTVTVLAETDGNAELVLTYVVTNAKWTPLYDLRASIAKSPGTASKVALHYRASITQTTGEDWPDVALTLSTASPQLGSKVPTLKTWRIGPPAPIPPPSPVVYHPAPLGRQGATRSAGFSGAPGAIMAEAFRSALPPPPPPMAVRKAHVASAGVLSATFGIPGQSNIPSDEGNHKVVIAVLDLEAELEWVCVPREKESVFLTCMVVNSSEFTLLPGEASVFLDNNFVSKSRIVHVSPNDSFKTSLGSDSAIHITYPSAKTLNRQTAQSSFSLLSKEKQTVSAQSQRIIIRNSRLASVSALRVLDHVPVSTDARIKVNMIAPTGLDAVAAPGSSEDEVKEQPWVNVRKGVRARWAPLAAGGEGTVEWRCEVAPTEAIELELAWEVSAPLGQQWQNL
ncbi:hypothetical protein CTheo_5165 [Ceratobasidium theobromae]|uniref:Protein F37C4,5 n=1 Tax=Ceratobasidium theobromae TaxID=1582974 RepID=A0A5N5QIW3_9AGAM|nr:hypothetical protein CTheo_5165 [Ceratobasidium theobromae]